MHRLEEPEEPNREDRPLRAPARTAADLRQRTAAFPCIASCNIAVRTGRNGYDGGLSGPRRDRTVAEVYWISSSTKSIGSAMEYPELRSIVKSGALSVRGMNSIMIPTR